MNLKYTLLIFLKLCMLYKINTIYNSIKYMSILLKNFNS